METFDIIVKIMEKYNVTYEVAESIFLNATRSCDLEDLLASLEISQKRL